MYYAIASSFRPSCATTYPGPIASCPFRRALPCQSRRTSEESRSPHDQEMPVKEKTKVRSATQREPIIIYRYSMLCPNLQSARASIIEMKPQDQKYQGKIYIKLCRMCAGTPSLACGEILHQLVKPVPDVHESVCVRVCVRKQKP